MYDKENLPRGIGISNWCETLAKVSLECHPQEDI